MESEFSRFVRQLEKIEMETKVKKVKINPKENAKWWYNLSLEDKQRSFYAVISRMHKAEIEDRGNYRHSLYDIFKFSADMHDVGIECGYKELHDKLEEDDVLDNLSNLQVSDESGIFNVDVNIDDMEIETEDSHGGGKTLKIKVINRQEEE
tara:strand:- start:40 stop:492 length:453 start_codon:yes stop_codon:yes gene_type:complete